MAVADPAYQVQSIAPWMSNAMPVGWTSSTNRIVYNSIGANGLWNAYSANPDGSGQQCLTCTVPNFPTVGTGTNRGAGDVSPNGQYMLVTVEEPVHLGPVGASWSAPGLGGANDVYLYTTDGQHAWNLTDIAAPGSGSFGTIWPRFNRTGTQIVWASCIQPAFANLGYWELKVANIVWNNGTPSLSDVRTIEPASNAFYEPYGFTPDDQHVVFASDAGQPGWLDDQIDTIGTDGTGLSQVSEQTPGEPNYNEFAFYTPGNDAIIYGGTRDTGSGGMDYWEMNPDGTGSQRLTYFNAPWSTEGMGYSDVETLAFNPNNPDQFVMALTPNVQDSDVQAEMVTLDPNLAGLTESLYTGDNFNELVTTATQDPGDGFEWDGAPASGVSADSYSVKWTGTVTPPASGSYQMCLVANPDGQLFVNGSELVNGTNSDGQRDCAAVNLTAGRGVPVRLDYEHTSGTGYGQLTWITPGAAVPTAIPIADMTPSVPPTTQGGGGGSGGSGASGNGAGGSGAGGNGAGGNAASGHGAGGGGVGRAAQRAPAASRMHRPGSPLRGPRPPGAALRTLAPGGRRRRARKAKRTKRRPVATIARKRTRRRPARSASARRPAVHRG